jgi:hypothetical protein
LIAFFFIEADAPLPPRGRLVTTASGSSANLFGDFRLRIDEARPGACAAAVGEGELGAIADSR